MLHDITWRNMLAIWASPSDVACKQTKDKHICRECTFKIALTRSIFSPKCTVYRLAAGLRPDPLGDLTALPKPPRWI